MPIGFRPPLNLITKISMFHQVKLHRDGPKWIYSYLVTGFARHLCHVSVSWIIRFVSGDWLTRRRIRSQSCQRHRVHDIPPTPRHPQRCNRDPPNLNCLLSDFAPSAHRNALFSHSVSEARNGIKLRNHVAFVVRDFDYKLRFYFWHNALLVMRLS